MSLSNTPHFQGFTFKLSPILNNPDHKNTVMAWFQSGHLQNGITQLKLESDDKFHTLILVLQRGFIRGIKIVSDKPSGFPLGGTYTAKEKELVMDIANMLTLAVGKYMSEHPEEVQSAEARGRHLDIAAMIFVEIFYEVSTGSDGGFTTAFLSNVLLALAVQTPQEQPASNETQNALDALTLKLESLLKTKDNQIHKLRAEMLPTQQLTTSLKRAQVAVGKLDKENRALKTRLQDKNKEIEKLELKIEESGVDTLRVELARTRKSLANEKAKNKDIFEA